MRGVSFRFVRWSTFCIGLTVLADRCDCADSTVEPSAASTQDACKAASDAEKDYVDFLRDYPANLPAARVDLANMESSLTAAEQEFGGKVAREVDDAIANALQAVDTAQKALNDGQPVNTGPIDKALSDIDNACSKALGG